MEPCPFIEPTRLKTPLYNCLLSKIPLRKLKITRLVRLDERYICSGHFTCGDNYVESIVTTSFIVQKMDDRDCVEVVTTILL
jgi:hypothetical protein